MRQSDLLAARTRRSTGSPEIDLREPPRVVAELAEDQEAEAQSARLEQFKTLTGRVAVVTGGAGPIGRSIAFALLDAGARVCVLDHDAEGLRATASAAQNASPIVYLQCDLGSVGDIEEAAEFIARFDRPVDVLVHGADCHVVAGVNGDVADLDEQYLLNVRGPYVLTQALGAQLEAGPGHVVFLEESLETVADDLQYAITRAAVGAFAAGLREAVDDDPVRVTTIRHDVSVDPDDVADAVMGAVEMPPHLELADVHIRAVDPSQ
jgi:NAD(P)-dependent dehydrogenase (short-subunit alcohol dehydrogenase family)